MYWRRHLRIWWLRLDILARTRYWRFWLALFFALRLLVIFLPGPGYSDVTHYYERYANVWQYGLPPYTHSVFEYGPIAAGVIWLPLTIDLLGVGQYYINYKFLSLIFDACMFAGLLWFARRQRDRDTWPLLLYLILTTIAKNWLYEGIDMIFASVSIGAILLLSLETKWSRWGSWLLLWASTAVKFLTLPLIAVWWLLTRRNWRTNFVVAATTFLVIWGIPLALYRSSLSVPFVYNGGRTIKYNTITHLVLRTINNVTHSEEQSEEAPDYSFAGPMSTTATRVLVILYPLSLLTVLLAQAAFLYHRETGRWWDRPVNLWRWLGTQSPETPRSRTQLAAWAYLSYFLVSFFTAKIYSNPFLLWILPLIVILRWASTTRQRRFYWLISIWTILELTPFLTASFWHLQSFSWFRYELFEVSYGWVKWAVMIGVVATVFGELRAQARQHVSTPTGRTD